MQYDYCGYELIFEAYDGAKEMRSCYILCHELRIDTTNKRYAFETIRSNKGKKELMDKLKKPGAINLVKASLRFKVENAMINATLKEFENKIEEKKSIDYEKLRFSNLMKMDLVDDFDDFYEEFGSLMPPIEELTLFVMDQVPEFIDPNTWTLNKCMDFLIN